MAEKLYDAYLTLGGTNVSSYIKSLELTESVDPQDDTVMGDTTKSNIAGLKDWSLTVTFVQGYGVGEVDTVIAAAGGVGALIAIVTRKASSAVGTSNPQWSGTGLVTEYKPVGGEVGGLHLTQLKMVPNTALTRATA